MTNKRTRIIVGIALIIGLAVIFWLALLNARASTAPEDVVERFYGHWIASSDPVGEELHQKSTYVTDGFARDVARAAERGDDAVLCGTPTKSYTIEPAAINDEATRASVELHTDTASIHVVLTRDKEGWWRIDETDCNKPTILDLEKAIEDARETYGDALLDNG